MPAAEGTSNEISGGVFFSAVIQGRDITVHLPREIRPALSGLPAGTPAFTGRDVDLGMLLQLLAPCQGENAGGLGKPRPPPISTAVVTSVGGLAGIGKTELAIQAARAAVDSGWFTGGVLFVDMLGYDPARRLEPGQALEAFLRALGVPGEHIPRRTQDRTRLYTSVLAAYAREGQRILVVIDNVATHDQVRPLLPADPVTAAIVTSRDTLGLLDARQLDLDVLAGDDAADMLDRVLRMRHPADIRVTAHRGDALSIAELCGRLPLALRIIAALLSDNVDRPLAQMAARLKDERTRLDELSYADTAVRAAFDLSYQRLEPDCARLFRLLTVNPGPEISTQAAASLAGTDQLPVSRWLETLARAHLVEDGSSYGQWRMHDLIRLYARERADLHAEADSQEQARDRLLRHYLDTAAAADGHLKALPGTPVPGPFSDSDAAMAWLDTQWPSLVAAVTMAAETGRDHIAMELPLSLIAYMSWRRRFDDWLMVAAISRDASRRLGERVNEARALNNLGSALREVRRFEDAIVAHQDAVTTFRQTGERRQEGMALGNLGNALHEARRFDDAISAHREAVAVFKETGDRHIEGRALGNLGLTLYQAGRFDEAIAAHQEAAAISRETGDVQGEAMALTNLGIALHEVQRFEEAIAAQQYAAASLRQISDRHNEAIALTGLGRAQVEQGRFVEAIRAHQDAVAIFREAGDRFREGEVLDNLGVALRRAGRVDEAIAMHRAAIGIFRELGSGQQERMALDNLELDLSSGV